MTTDPSLGTPTPSSRSWYEHVKLATRLLSCKAICPKPKHDFPKACLQGLWGVDARPASTRMRHFIRRPNLLGPLAGDSEYASLAKQSVNSANRKGKI